MDDDGERMVVDGETFIVRQTSDGAWSYDWVSGPNPNYGFGSQVRRYEYIDAGDGTIVPGSGRYVDPGPDAYLPDHEESIRNFLAQIDPETGYIGD